MSAETPALASIPFAPWSFCAQPPGSIANPEQLETARAHWLPAPVPGTVAEALQASGMWEVNHPRDLDAEDWWYRTTFPAPDLPANSPCYLSFDGLATLTEVWLNGRRVLTTENMFRTYRIDVGPLLLPHNTLVLRFCSLNEELKKKRPRPRWKTNLVAQQQLRWYRTSLLGRIPGWSPPVPAVGPWRAIHLETTSLSRSDLCLTSCLEGEDGLVQMSARFKSRQSVERANLQVGNQEVQATLSREGNHWLLQGELRISRPSLWWPHTHGDQPLYDCGLELLIDGEQRMIACGRIGFRRVTVSQEPFSIAVNGVPVYCRGACWTVANILSPGGSEETVKRDLHLARDASVNMLRVGGTMVYESDHFYRLCDELGILVWQDFMFANMDYPVEDPGFAANIESEAKEQFSRLSSHPCLAVWCGNSEVEQQAAMRGVPREFWRNDWFGKRLPELGAERSPGTGYVPSTPSGGALPFHLRDGVAHYYGVGAYQRSPADLRKDDIKFSPECLGFANIPEPDTLATLGVGDPPVLHHPRWKQRVPRDTGAGWDFDDVRDFYLRHFFGVDPNKLRAFDPHRYLHLSWVVPGEMMTQVFAEWRSGHSRNAGGLVWFFKDLWPGAGWGIVDSLGRPKVAYYYLRRSWQPRQLTLTDEGLDGIHLHVINETAHPLNGSLELILLKAGHIVVAHQEVPCELAPRARRTFAADAILDGFHDLTHSYRFGPPQQDVVIATLLDERHQVLSEAFHFVSPCEPAFVRNSKIDIETERVGAGCYQVSLYSDHFLQSVSLSAQGFLPDDNYFHLPPSRTKQVRFKGADGSSARFRATLEAVNLENPVGIRLKEIPTQE